MRSYFCPQERGRQDSVRVGVRGRYETVEKGPGIASSCEW